MAIIFLLSLNVHVPTNSYFTFASSYKFLDSYYSVNLIIIQRYFCFYFPQVDVEKSAEEGRVVFQAPGVVAAATATVGLSLAEFIVKRLTVERVEELRANVADTRKKYRYMLNLMVNT